MDFLPPAALVSPSLGDTLAPPYPCSSYLDTKHPSCCSLSPNTADTPMDAAPPTAHRSPSLGEIPALLCPYDYFRNIKHPSCCTCLPNPTDMPMDFLSPTALVSPSPEDIPALPCPCNYFDNTNFPNYCISSPNMVYMPMDFLPTAAPASLSLGDTLAPPYPCGSYLDTKCPIYWLHLRSDFYRRPVRHISNTVLPAEWHVYSHSDRLSITHILAWQFFLDFCVFPTQRLFQSTLRSGRIGSDRAPWSLECGSFADIPAHIVRTAYLCAEQVHLCGQYPFQCSAC